MSQIPSPCVRVCVIDEDLGLCVGCGRSLGEIGSWLAMSDQERLRIMAVLDERLRQVSGTSQQER